jgi:DNA-binding XRE family transcriptional regulator
MAPPGKIPHKVSEPQSFRAPDGTEMVIMPRALWAKTLDRADRASRVSDCCDEESQMIIPIDVKMYIRLGLKPVAAWRRYAGFTQAALAKKVGLTQAAIARIEAGPPGAGRDDTLLAIARVLGAPLAHINPPPQTPEEKFRKALAYSADKRGRILRVPPK